MGKKLLIHPVQKNCFEFFLKITGTPIQLQRNYRKRQWVANPVTIAREDTNVRDAREDWIVRRQKILAISLTGRIIVNYLSSNRKPVISQSPPSWQFHPRRRRNLDHIQRQSRGAEWLGERSTKTVEIKETREKKKRNAKAEKRLAYQLRSRGAIGLSAAERSEAVAD